VPCTGSTAAVAGGECQQCIDQQARIADGVARKRPSRRQVSRSTEKTGRGLTDFFGEKIAIAQNAQCSHSVRPEIDADASTHAHRHIANGPAGRDTGAAVITIGQRPFCIVYVRRSEVQ
jgi:hypothetical protein